MPEEHRVAVAVIHGMGSQGDRPQAANAVSFSRDLYAGLRKRMGATRFDTLVGWREISGRTSCKSGNSNIWMRHWRARPTGWLGGIS